MTSGGLGSFPDWASPDEVNSTVSVGCHCQSERIVLGASQDQTTAVGPTLSELLRPRVCPAWDGLSGSESEFDFVVTNGGARGLG